MMLKARKEGRKGVLVLLRGVRVAYKEGKTFNLKSVIDYKSMNLNIATRHNRMTTVSLGFGFFNLHTKRQTKRKKPKGSLAGSQVVSVANNKQCSAYSCSGC